MKGKKTSNSFFLFFFLVMVLTGIFLFIYCLFIQVHPLSVYPQSSPIFYLVLGFGLLVVKLVKDNEIKLKEGKAPFIMILLFILLIIMGVIIWGFIFSYMS